MSAASVALRLARREVVRRPWRSLVVMLLVIVPVAALTGFAVMVRTMQQPVDFDARWGADAVAVIDPVPADAFEGASRTTIRTAQTRIKTTDGDREWIEVTDHVPFGGDWPAIIEDLDGRAPNGPDEVLLSADLAEELGLTVGDTLAVERPLETEAIVVGTARWRMDLDRMAVMVDHGADGTLIDQIAGLPQSWIEHRTLLDWPDGFTPDAELSAELQLFFVENRWFDVHDADDGSAQLAIVWSWVGGTVAFVIVGVVITAAFAVTARRQLRLIGQLMGNGASGSTLRSTLALQGSVIGFAGAVVGIVLTLVGLEVAQPLIERAVDRRIPAYDVRLADLVPILVLGTVAATVAALIPARVAVRTSVLQALAGRRPIGPYPARVVAWGAAACTGGLGLLAVSAAGAVRDGRAGGDATWLFVLTGIAGSLGVILGTCAMAPAIISRLEPLARHLGGTSRLAARSVARQRTRTGAVVAAVACVGAGAVAASTVWLTALAAEEEPAYWQIPDDAVQVSVHDGESGTSFRPPPSEGLADLATVLPDAEVVPSRTAQIPEMSASLSFDDRMLTSGPLLVVDDAIAEVLDLDPEVRDALGRDGAVVPDWTLDMGGPQFSDPAAYALVDDDGNIGDLELTAVGTNPAIIPPYGALLTESTARELGLSIEPGPTFLHAPEALTTAQRDALRDIQEDAWLEPTPTNLSFHDPMWVPPFALVTAIIVAVATAIALGVVGLGLALSAAETKDERDVLSVIGARPSALRRLASAKALVLAVLGTVIGVPLGFVPVWVVASAADAGSRSPATVVFPSVQVVLLVVAVPLVAAVATHLATAVSLRVRPVQASTMAFD